MKGVPHGSIHYCRVVCRLLCKFLFCFLGTCQKAADVQTGGGNGQKAYGSEHAETASYVIRNNKCLVTFLGAQGLEGAASGIGNGDNADCGFLLAVTLLDVLLNNTESDCRLCGGAALGYDDAGNVALCSKVHELCQILLREVVAGKDYLRGVLFLELLGKVVAKGLNYALCAKIASADADCNHKVNSALFPVCADGVYVVQHFSGNFGGEVLPAKEVISCAFFGFKDVECVQGLLYIGIILGGIYE